MVREDGGWRQGCSAAASDVDKREEVGIGGICRDYALENGLVMRAVGDSMIMCPPLIISKLEIDELVEKTKKSLDQTLTQVEG